MARLQDFQTVTPASADNMLIVQSQGQGLATVEAMRQKMAGDTDIGDLKDASITSPQANQVIMHDGNGWKNSNIKGLFLVERKWRNVTFDNYYASVTMDISKSGYTPIGVVGFQTNTVGSLFFRCNLDVPNNNLLFGLVAREGVTPISGTVAAYIDILYIKN